MYGHNRRQQRSKGGTSQSQIAVIDAAVKKAHSDLLAAGESVTAWRVSQAALVMLKADSFESLGFHMQNVPSLYQIIITEAKEIWLRVQQMMKGSDIGIQEKKAKLFNEWEREILLSASLIYKHKFINIRVDSLNMFLRSIWCKHGYIG
nr:histidine kinase-like ATPase, C-terminal domain-containing protein [Tanacetum cinerariifolium]